MPISGNPESLRSKGLFYLLLDAIINNSEEENDTQRRIISRAKTLLVGKALSISEIAKECAMSDSGFRRIFKEQTGMTPVEYRISSRIKRAAYLLDSTGMSVGEIAESIGFFDAAYFCKVFKKYFGITPKQYSKSKNI